MLPLSPLPCRRWKGHTDAVTDVQLSLSAATSLFQPAFPSQLLASTSDDCTTRIWQLPVDDTAAASVTRCLRFKANGAVQPVTCCCWHSDPSSLTLFTAHTRCVAVWQLHSSSESLVCTQPTQLLPLLASGAEESKETGDAEGEDEVNQLLVSSDGSMLAACDDSGRWYSWRITTSAGRSCQPSLAFEWLGSLRPPHANICSSIALLPPRTLPASHPCGPSSPPLVLSAGFDYTLRLTTADGKQRLQEWNVNEWVEEQRRAVDGEHGSEQAPVAVAGRDNRQQPTKQDSSAPRRGQTTAERLRGKLKQKQTAASAPPAARSSSQPTTASSSSSPLTNPPFPHCLAASPHSRCVLVGLGDGQLALLSPAAAAAAAAAASALTAAAAYRRLPLLVDAHAHAVVAVVWIGRARSGCEYWASAGSDRRLAVWRSGVRDTTADIQASSRKGEQEAHKCDEEGGVDRLDGLAAAGADGSGTAGLQCVWSAAHRWKVNGVSCESGAVHVRLYVADVSQRVAAYSVT